MAEIKVLTEPASPWSGVAIGAVGLGAAAFIVARGVDPALEPSVRHPVMQTALLATLVVVATVAVIGALVAAPRRLGYVIRGDRLVVRTLLGSRRIRLSEVVQAEQLPYRLPILGVHFGWPRSHVPGYYVGMFRLHDVGITQVAVGARSGEGVLLRLGGGGSLLLAPRDPAALVAAVQRQRDAARSRSASSRRGRRRR